MLKLKPMHVYLIFIEIMLIGTTVLVQTKFQFWFCCFLLVMYSALIVYIFSSSEKNRQKKLFTIEEQLKTSQRPKWIDKLEQEARNIMIQVRAQQESEEMYDNDQRMNYDSPYQMLNSSRRQFPTTLKNVTHPNSIHDFGTQNQIMINYCNNSFWKRQLKEVFDYFFENLTMDSDVKYLSSKKDYDDLLGGFGLGGKKKQEAEKIVEQFLLDKLRNKMELCEAKINEANNIVSRHFGKTLINGQTVSNDQISLQQLKKITEFYRRYRILPEKYTSKYSPQKINTDMEKLIILEDHISALICFPQEMQPIKILVNILSEEFPTQKIEINKSEYLIKKSENAFILMVLSDFSMKLSAFQDYRTRNCRSIALIFLLELVKRRTKTNHPIFRQIKSLTN